MSALLLDEPAITRGEPARTTPSLAEARTAVAERRSLRDPLEGLTDVDMTFVAIGAAVERFEAWFRQALRGWLGRRP